MVNLQNSNIELNTSSFYGCLSKSQLSKGNDVYLTPLERKSIREQNFKSQNTSRHDPIINVVSKKKRRNSNNQKENHPQKIKLKTGALVWKEDVDFEVDEKSISSKPLQNRRSSPTINWKPSSLNKKSLKSPRLKYANMKLKNTTPLSDKIVKKATSQPVISSKSSACKEIHDPDEHYQFSLQSPKVPMQEPPQNLNDTASSPVKELKYSQESLNSTDSGVRSEDLTPNKTQVQLTPKNKGRSERKLFPIFESAKNSSPRRISARLQDKNATLKDATLSSPNPKTIALPGTTKSRKCASPTSRSPASKQLIIDAGQKAFGASQCNVCGMVYTVNHPEDQQMHKLHHNRFVSCIKFPGWKKERIVSNFMDGRILKVLSNDPKFAVKKVEEICSLIDLELGFNSNRGSISSSFRPLVTYLYVSDDNQIVGCLICEPITEAYRLLPSDTEPAALLCEVTPQPATCGVSRIWTWSCFRRQGIARKLCDAVRRSFVIGSQLELNQIAFSHPSPAGRSFAAKYCGTQQFLTYNFSH
uniref:N-acetyltransferase ESCO2 n=1 Tax=Phallusia mammillata TaxID=59560 RepID=A0A6F9DCY0_9ASCI|nr:N-acetyltransferase ESCO2 [Phallusia mammillata]